MYCYAIKPLKVRCFIYLYLSPLPWAFVTLFVFLLKIATFWYLSIKGHHSTENGSVVLTKRGQPWQRHQGETISYCIKLPPLPHCTRVNKASCCDSQISKCQWLNIIKVYFCSPVKSDEGVQGWRTAFSVVIQGLLPPYGSNFARISDFSVGSSASNWQIGTEKIQRIP